MRSVHRQMLAPLVQESQQTTSMAPPNHAPPNIIQKQTPPPELLRRVRTRPSMNSLDSSDGAQLRKSFAQRPGARRNRLLTPARENTPRPCGVFHEPINSYASTKDRLPFRNRRAPSTYS